ncbi:MAG: gluconate 2-dehydrogenase subunit 3 family protein [Lacibacter sp.]
MNRRDAVKSLGLVSGHVLFPSVLAGFLSSWTHKDISSYSPVFFSSGEFKLVTEIIDIIIPATKTASASQVNTQVFLDQVFSQCMTADQQQVIHDGLSHISSSFSNANDKMQFMLDVDQKAFAKDKSYAWFKTLKRFTMIGFFTSQEGTTKASNYVKVPDAYKGEIPADSNTLNYGKTNLRF